MDQLQREQRYLRRRLEQLGVERTRMDSTGSNVSSEKSDSDQGGPPREGRRSLWAAAAEAALVRALLCLQPPRHLLDLAAEAAMLVVRGDKFQKLITGFMK